MPRIYKRDCYFFESDKTIRSCELGHMLCFICLSKIRKIRGLRASDYVGLSSAKKAFRINLIISIVAIIIAAYSLSIACSFFE